MTIRMRPTSVLALLAVTACSGGDPETKTNTVNNTITNTNTNTVTHTVTPPSTELQPGHFEEPLQELAEITSDDGASHLDELRYRESDGWMFYCSYNFGVIDASDPTDPEYLFGGMDWDLGSPVDRSTGCLHVDWEDADPDIAYVSHRGNYDFQPHLSVIDLNPTVLDPLEPEEITLVPIQAPSLREPGVSYEGLDAENGLVYVALHAGGIGVFVRDPATNEMSRVGDSPIVPNAYDIKVVGTTAYVVDEQEGLFILDVSDPTDITELSHLPIGGIQRDLQVQGEYVYIAAGPLGLAIVDATDPANPTIASFVDAPGTATRVGVSGDYAAIAAWNDTRVYDVSDRTTPAIIGAVRIEQDQGYTDDFLGRPDITTRTLGVDIFGDYLFAGTWDGAYSHFIHPDRLAPYAVLPEDIHYMSIGPVEVGASSTYTVDIENDGTAPLTVYDTWTTNPAFVVTPTDVLIAPGGEAEFTITYTATSLTDETGLVTFLMDDPSFPVRNGYVVGNAEGIGVGDPFPYSEGRDVSSLDEWTSDEMAGRVTLVAYFATF